MGMDLGWCRINPILYPRPFTFILVLLLSSPAFAATPDISGEWTDGYMFFSGGRLNDSTWAFDGGNLHEGGYRFALRRLTDSSFFLTGA
jgi:lysophospholipase L1-like esterase